MAELPHAEKALRSGELSEIQAAHVASAASASPSSEGELVEAAKRQGLGELKQHCARVKAAALPDKLARHEAIHRSRYLRTWTDAGGVFRLDGRFTPEAGAVLLAALRPRAARLAAGARAGGAGSGMRPLPQTPWSRRPAT